MLWKRRVMNGDNLLFRDRGMGLPPSSPRLDCGSDAFLFFFRLRIARFHVANYFQQEEDAKPVGLRVPLSSWHLNASKI